MVRPGSMLNAGSVWAGLMLGGAGRVKRACGFPTPRRPAGRLRSRPWPVLGAKRPAVRAAGIDVGKVRVGVAVADDLGLMAHPRPFLDGRDPKRAIAALVALAAEEGIEIFVVGLPRTLKGEVGPSARKARRFAEALAAQSGRPVELMDEWLSTKEARGRLRDQGLDDREARQRIDSAAAAVVLQSWLDGRRGMASRGRSE